MFDQSGEYLMKAIITLLICSVLCVNTVHSGDVYKITKSTLQASGGTASNNQYEIKSSLGQPSASNTASGGVYQSNGGIWSVATYTNDIIFKNGFNN